MTKTAILLLVPVLLAACANSEDSVGGGGSGGFFDGGAGNGAFGGFGATGGTAGTAGTSGTAGTGGGAGAAGSAGTGGAAGTAGAAGSAGAGGTSSCIELSPTAFSIDPNGTSTAQGVVGSPGATLGGALPDSFYVQFYSDTTGSFDLASGNNASFATCDQCVLVTQDVSGTTASKYFYQSAGSIQVNKPPISSGGISGSLSNVTLVEVTIDSNYVSTPVPGGACLHVSSASFDAGCGNNVLESGEACDGTALGSSTCSTFGFTGGQLGCSSSCQYDTSGCTGFSCSATDLGTFAGTTLNETGDTCTATSQYDVAQSPTSACSFNDSPGPERLYALTLQPGTKVRVDLTNIAFDAALWVVTSCADKTGNTCVDISDTLGNESLTLENTSSADATYYVIVDGYSTSDCGTYALTISDIAVPGSWTCDPSYFAALDGCDCECGAWDPDCNDPNASVYGCSSSQSCVQPGVCQ